MQNLDANLTPAVLLRRIKMNEYIQRFGLPYNESLICAFKCTCKQSISRLGKMYVFNRYICFWPQVLKSSADVWKFDDIAGISVHEKSFTITLIKHDCIRVRGIENAEKIIQIVGQHWNAYCLCNNRALLTTDSETERLSDDSDDFSTESVLTGSPGELTANTSLTTTPRPSITAQPPSNKPEKASYEGFLISTEFQPGGETELDCSVREFYDKFISSEGREQYIKLLEAKEITNINVTEWEASDKFGFIRRLDFVVPLKGVPFGPSTARTLSTEIHYFDGDSLVFCSSNQTPDVPYGDSFKLEFKTVVTPTGEHSCHYTTTFAVLFLKKTMLRGTIESQGVSNAKKDVETMIKLYKQGISGKVSDDIEFIDESATEPKLFKQNKMRTLIETTIPMKHMEFFKLFVSEESVDRQIQLKEEAGETNVEMTCWKPVPNGYMRTITTISPVITPTGTVTTRTRAQQFYQLKKGHLVIGTLMNYLDAQENVVTETRMTVTTNTKDESIVTVQGGVIQKKKGEEKDRDIMLKLEKEYRTHLQRIVETYEHIKLSEELENKGIVTKVTHKVSELSFHEKMLVIQNTLLFLIFLALLGIVHK